MNGIWEFIKGMTIWNWLSLIAFIFFPLSALNAFLSLKSRYLDWQGTKNKKEFEKRLKQLEDLVNKTGNYRKDIKTYVFQVSHFMALILLIVLAAIFVFVAAFINSFAPIGDRYLALTLLLICEFLLWFALIYANRLVRLVKYVNRPELLKKEVSDFLLNGVKKGFVSTESGKEMVETLFHNNLLTIGEAEELETIVNNSQKPQ